MFINECFSKIKTNLLKTVILHHQIYRMKRAMHCGFPFEKFHESSAWSQSLISATISLLRGKDKKYTGQLDLPKFFYLFMRLNLHY